MTAPVKPRKPLPKILERRAYAATSRVGELRAYGNAINPHLAAEFISAYLES